MSNITFWIVLGEGILFIVGGSCILNWWSNRKVRSDSKGNSRIDLSFVGIQDKAGTSMGDKKIYSISASRLGL